MTGAGVALIMGGLVALAALRWLLSAGAGERRRGRGARGRRTAATSRAGGGTGRSQPRSRAAIRPGPVSDADDGPVRGAADTTGGFLPESGGLAVADPVSGTPFRTGGTGAGDNGYGDTGYDGSGYGTPVSEPFPAAAYVERSVVDGGDPNAPSRSEPEWPPYGAADADQMYRWAEAEPVVDPAHASHRDEAEHDGADDDLGGAGAIGVAPEQYPREESDYVPLAALWPDAAHTAEVPRHGDLAGTTEPDRYPPAPVSPVLGALSAEPVPALRRDRPADPGSRPRRLVALRRRGRRVEHPADAPGGQVAREPVVHPRAEARRRQTAATEVIPAVSVLTALLPAFGESAVGVAGDDSGGAAGDGSGGASTWHHGTGTSHPSGWNGSTGWDGTRWASTAAPGTGGSPQDGESLPDGGWAGAPTGNAAAARDGRRVWTGEPGRDAEAPRPRPRPRPRPTAGPREKPPAPNRSNVYVSRHATDQH